MKLYLNGILVGENDSAGNLPKFDAEQLNTFGKSHWKDNDDFKGQLDEIRVWKGARTGNQIRASTQKFEMHYTPKKASWLNMVEIELSALSKQCLDRRIGDRETLESEVLAWVASRNEKKVTVNWQFSIDAAREKFSRFYPNG
ncbi:transposase [Candidatus Poribacteria bacterium]|nr:transposase [Candidatus Poribacteria bacterium]